MTFLSQKLYESLSVVPQSKAELAERLGCSEREVRRSVSELRELGFNVASNSRSKGYWLGDDKDRINTVCELRSRAQKLLRTATALEKGPDLGQLEVTL